LLVEDIKEVVRGFRDAARRAVKTGVGVIEIHAAHGYLLCSFLSPLSNRRTDAYGGSFENRPKALVETVKAMRETIPANMPLLLRVSATEWMDGHPDGSWDVLQAIRLAKMLPALGVDLLDVSSGGNHRDQNIAIFNDFQVGIAGQIRAALWDEGIKLLIGAVGMITDADVGKSILEGGEAARATPGDGRDDGAIEIEGEQGKVVKADVVLVARQFSREPEWAFRVAYRLGVKVLWPNQDHRGDVHHGEQDMIWV
jgi:2,4-dienoyl-CoA reductase-like NADH-dependent reductase (Old Yellow Enzyme family)